MRIRQLLTVFTSALLVALTPQTFAQDYTPSDAVTEAIVDAQADGVITDAEAASLAQAIAADGGNAAAVATTLNNNGASSVQVAAGLATVGQTQAQIAATLVSTGVTAQAQAQTTAQAGQQAAVSAGARTVTSATQASAVASTLQVNGAGLITDSSGKAVVVQNAGDQLLLLKAVVVANAANQQRSCISAFESCGNVEFFSSTTVNALAGVMRNIVTSLGVSGDSVTRAVDNFLNELDYVNRNGADGLTGDILSDALDGIIGDVEQETGTDLNNDGGVGDSPNTIS